MLLKITPYIALVLVIFGCKSQQPGVETYRKNYFGGYLVSNYGDTLRGRIKSQDEYDSRISFIKADTDKIISLNTSDFKSMKINILLFEKINVNGKDRMYEKVATGKLDLFAYHYMRGDISENIYYLRLPDGAKRITANNFKTFATEYLFDCKAVREKILAKELGYDQLIEIFRIYNSCDNSAE